MQRTPGVEPPPFIGNGAIDRQNVFAKGLIDGCRRRRASDDVFFHRR